MEKCIEVLACKVLPDKVQQFIDINKERHQVMLGVEGCSGVFLLQLPFVDNGYLRCVVWDSKDRALRYCGERLQRDRYLQFLAENVKELAIFFLDTIDIADSSHVTDNIKQVFGATGSTTGETS